MMILFHLHKRIALSLDLIEEEIGGENGDVCTITGKSL